MTVRAPCIRFRTGRRSPAWLDAPPSAAMVGRVIQDRAELQAAGIKPPARRGPSFWEARDWAMRVGFTGVDVYAAAAAALMLRSVHGEGRVTVEMVRAKMGQR